MILGIYYKIPYDVMEKSILNLTKMNSRLQIRHDHNLKIYDDSYNSNLKGSLNALESISKEKGFKFIITPGFVEMDLVLEKEMKEYAEKIDKVIDYKFIIHSHSGDILYDMLNGKNAYLIDSFLDGYKIVKNFKCYHSKTLLIENDLTDYYERMNI